MKLRLFLFGFILSISVQLHASTVVQVTFDQLVTSSECIFEGRVIDERAEFDSNGRIHTYVTFAVEDVLKGTFGGRTLILRYLGGTVGDTTLRISDLSLPETGEKGIYFVESLTRLQVHPLYGWDQGHFLVATSKTDQTERVLSRNHRPITGVTTLPAKAGGLSTGIAMGLSVADASRSNEAMTVREFKQKVLELKSR
ncbi:MAG TPA: hypothetical protein VE422_21695 [Terriglobia bacterium]|nr:hypothetical protein [Terriglobia bacterium]